MALKDNWEDEVKREIHRIKSKNKELKKARAKREQQIKTMHKLQCLNLAKNFLNGCFKGTLSHLAKKSYWRDTFMDQLSISYKNFLVDKTQSDTNKFIVAEDFLEGVVREQVFAVAKHKEEIK